MLEEFDSNNGYCRMLGHAIEFSYCRKAKEKLPCHRIKDCWFESIPIEKFITRQFDLEEQAKIFSPPQPNLLSLIDFINQAKENQKTLTHK